MPGEKMKAIDIYKMELHEKLILPAGGLRVLRVPGGWIYGFQNSTCFVPFHNEFQPKPKAKKVEGGWYEQVVGIYHRCLPGLPQVAQLTDKRKKAIRARTADSLPKLEDWEAYFTDASNKSFLFGRNDRQWRADFDFLLREDTIAKMQEGKYDNR